MSNDAIVAAAFYVRVCVEHERVFPLRNILIVAPHYVDANDEDRFVSDVEDVLDRYRLGEEIEGLEDALRDEFGGL